MKTLKRTLVLLLVLAMSVSLFSVAAFAKDYEDFTDADKIGDSYKEAVDVMVSIGVIDGISDTIFDAQGNFTREQAAKIMAYIMLGADAADALTAQSAPFSDVPANHWSAGYIAYCVEQGIIDGRGDGTFDPYSKLTAAEFAKMILCAIGYGVNDEYTGNLWYVTAQADAKKLGIFDNSGAASFTAPATREEAVLYAFNGLIIPMVKYVELLNSYVAIGAMDERDAAYLANNFDLWFDKADATDAYGRDGRLWFYDKNGNGEKDATEKEVAGPYKDDNMVATAIVADADADELEFIADMLGVKATGEKVAEKLADGYTTFINGESAGDDYADLALTAGDVVELYKDDNGDIDNIVVIRQFLVQVTAVVEAGKNDDHDYNVELTMWSNGAATANTIDTTDDAMGAAFNEIKSADYSKDMSDDSYFFFATVRTGDISEDEDQYAEITKVDPIQGSVLKKLNADNRITVDGKNYIVATVETYNANNVTFFNGKLTNDYVWNFYLSNGYVIGYNEYEDNADTLYAYVLGIQANTSGGGLFDNSDKTVGVKAKIVTLDGKVQTVDLPVDEDDDTFKYDGDDKLVSNYDDDYDDNITKFCSYTINKDGEYLFEEEGDATTVYDNIAVLEGKAAVKSADKTIGVADKNTVLTVIPFEYDSADLFKKVDSVTTYTGYSNFPDKTFPDDVTNNLNNMSVLVLRNDNGTIESIFIVGHESGETNDVNAALYLGEGEGDNDGTMYNFFVDGKVQSFYMTSDYGLTQANAETGSYTFYDLTIDLSDNSAKPVDQNPDNEEYALDMKDAVIKTASNGAYFTYMRDHDADAGTPDEEEVIYFAEDCTVYDVTNSDDAKWGTGTLRADDNIVYLTNDEGEATVIFIVNLPD